MHPKKIVLATLLALCGGLAPAQAVYRCGNSYSQQPCAGGTEISAADPRTKAETQQATRVANADARLADQMEKARLAQEKNAPRALIIGPREPVPVKEAAGSKPSGQAKGKPQHFTATSPPPADSGKKKTKKKAG